VNLKKGTENIIPRQSVLARNVFSNWVLFVFGVVVNFFLSPFVVHHLGNTAFGAWALVVTLTSYLQFLDFGVRNAVTRYVSKLQAQGDHRSASAVVSTALAIFLAGGFLSIAVAALGAVYAIPCLTSRGFTSRRRRSPFQLRAPLWLCGSLEAYSLEPSRGCNDSRL
jgi:hypothetical protein